MAKNSGPNTQIPIDQPKRTEPGLMYREKEIFSQDGETAVTLGFVRDQIAATSSIGKLMGNRLDGGKWGPKPRATDNGTTPFANMRGGNRR